MTVAEMLAQRSHGIRFEDLDPQAARWAKMMILDTLGVALAGSVEDSVRMLERVAVAYGNNITNNNKSNNGTKSSGSNNSSGNCLLWGTDRYAGPLDAALINGTAAHTLDFDCSSSTLGGHPTVHLVPALYALSEEIEADGRTLMAAFTAGMATQLYIARGAQPRLFLDGWFTSSTIGVFGAAAGACRLLNLSAAQTAQALGVASMLASGVISNAGTMTKPLGAGHCARNGLLAALLAREGYTGATDAIENKRGFLELFNGSGRYDVDAILSGATDPYDILSRGLSVKQYPCCGIVQAHIDVLRRLITEHNLVASQVQRIDALVHPQRIHHVDRADPHNNVEAKFSAYYCLALTLLQGYPRLHDFEGARYNAPAVRQLMARIHIAPDPAGAATADSLGEQFGATVRITTIDGRSLQGSADAALGGGPQTPLPQELLEAKFMNCAERVIDRAAAAQLLDMLWHLEEVSSMRSISTTMRATMVQR